MMPRTASAGNKSRKAAGNKSGAKPLDLMAPLGK